MHPSRVRIFNGQKVSAGVRVSESVYRTLPSPVPWSPKSNPNNDTTIVDDDTTTVSGTPTFMSSSSSSSIKKTHVPGSVSPMVTYNVDADSDNLLNTILTRDELTLYTKVFKDCINAFQSQLNGRPSEQSFPLLQELAIMFKNDADIMTRWSNLIRLAPVVFSSQTVQWLWMIVAPTIHMDNYQQTITRDYVISAAQLLRDLLTPHLIGNAPAWLPSGLSIALFGTSTNGVMTVEDLPNISDTDPNLIGILNQTEKTIYPLDKMYVGYDNYAVPVTGVLRPDGSVVSGRRAIFFANGIFTDALCMKQMLDIMEWMFDQKIVGLFNPTKSVVSDIADITVQKFFRENSPGVQNMIVPILDALMNEEIVEILLIVHSGATVSAGILLRLFRKFTTIASHLWKLRVFSIATASSETKGFITVDNNNPSFFKALPYIEHFANEYDPVANFGILHPEFQRNLDGPIYMRKQGIGHNLYDHYLKYLLRDVAYLNEHMEDFVDPDTSKFDALLPHMTYQQVKRKDGRFSEKYPDALSWMWEFIVRWDIKTYNSTRALPRFGWFLNDQQVA